MSRPPAPLDPAASADDALAAYLGAQEGGLDADTKLAILCVARIQRVAGAISAVLERVAQQFGLYAGDIYTLYLLQRAPAHAARPGDLAKSLSMTTGGMTKRLDRLEKAGLVVREREPDDRRGVTIRLTDEGLKTAKAARREHRRQQPHAMFEGFSPTELAHFAGYLDRAEALFGAPAPP